jgi:hypothetical protein
MATTSQLVILYVYACCKQLELKECSQEHSATHKEFIFCILALQRKKTHAHGMFYGRTTQLALSLKHEVQSFYKSKHTSTMFLKSLQTRIHNLSKQNQLSLSREYQSRIFIKVLQALQLQTNFYSYTRFGS